MNRTQRGTRGSIALLSLLVVTLVAPGVALAAGGGLRLALAPIGQTGPYFDLIMRPGDSARLGVDIANDGETSVAARTYAADVYTITNGGYGGRLRDEAQTGATTWLDYPTSVLPLRSGEHVRRSLTVTVPLDAGPGEYMSSLVLENDAPVRDDGDVSFDQIVRQAIGVVITVPGVRHPSLTVGDARQDIVAGKSIVSVAVQNDGNTRLKPVVDFVLRDATGAQVSHASLQMDTFYAHTDTLVAVPLAAPLLPGHYSVELRLADASQAIRVAATIDLVVAEPSTPAQAVVAGPALAAVVQGPTNQSSDVGLVAAIALIILGLWASVVVHRRRRARR